MSIATSIVAAPPAWPSRLLGGFKFCELVGQVGDRPSSRFDFVCLVGRHSRVNRGLKSFLLDLHQRIDFFLELLGWVRDYGRTVVHFRVLTPILECPFSTGCDLNHTDWQPIVSILHLYRFSFDRRAHSPGHIAGGGAGDALSLLFCRLVRATRHRRGAAA